MNGLNRYIFIIVVLLAMSCAKENLPEDDTPMDAYNKLYSPQSGGFQEKSKIFLNVGASDTTLKTFSVGIGGNIKTSADILLSFTVLGQEFVDAYNSKYSSKYMLMPQGSYSFSQNIVLKSGETTTGQIPVTINKSGLLNKTDYLLPIMFTTGSGVPVDNLRQVIYIPFRTRKMFTGKKIGKISQLSDPRADLFDFYGDVMLKDTSGNLWVYPLESNGNDTLGAPKLVGTGYGGYECFMFHPFYDKLFALAINHKAYNFGNAPGSGGPYSFTVSRYPDVKIGPPNQLVQIPAYNTSDIPTGVGNPQIIVSGNGLPYSVANSDWGYIGYTADKSRRFFAGVNGYTHFVHYVNSNGSGHTRFARLDGLGRFPTGTANLRGQTSWQPTQKSLCTLHDAAIVLNRDQVQMYGSDNPYWGAYPGYNYVTKVGDGNFYNKYVRLFSIYQKDLVFYEFDGDIVRYEDPDFESIWTPTNVD